MPSCFKIFDLVQRTGSLQRFGFHKAALKPFQRVPIMIPETYPSLNRPMPLYSDCQRAALTGPSRFTVGVATVGVATVGVATVPVTRIDDRCRPPRRRPNGGGATPTAAGGRPLPRFLELA
jgi:hypothetical protein